MSQVDTPLGRPRTSLVMDNETVRGTATVQHQLPSPSKAPRIQLIHHRDSTKNHAVSIPILLLSQLVTALSVVVVVAEVAGVDAEAEVVEDDIHRLRHLVGPSSMASGHLHQNRWTA